MLVELERPFVWPEEPESFEQYVLERGMLEMELKGRWLADIFDSLLDGTKRHTTRRRKTRMSSKRA